MAETKKVPKVRLSPTMASFGSTGKNTVLIAGMSRRTVAKHNRIFATNNSPATPASARTGSGRDHTDRKRLRNVMLIFRSCTIAARADFVRRCFSSARFGPFQEDQFGPDLRFRLRR